MVKRTRQASKSRKERKTRERVAPEAASAGLAAQVTSYDVAQLAGVSQSAVSRCFRPDASISEQMRNNVLAAARKLGYAPDAIARSLTTRRSNLIGVIISNLTNLYYPEVLSELNARCAEHNVHLLLFTIQGENDVDRVLAGVWQYRLDGVIAAARLRADQVKEFERRKVALVLYNRLMRERDVSAVYCDQAGSARIIIDGLVRAGCRRFGLIGGPKDSVVGAERMEACVERLGHYGVKSFARVDSDYTYAGGKAAFATIRNKLGRSPQAVIAANDVMALGCLDSARYEYKLNVPDGISVVGFDGVEPGTWMSYGLVTVRQPVQEMAAAAVSLLLENIIHPGRHPERRIFAGTLVPGTSAKLLSAPE